MNYSNSNHYLPFRAIHIDNNNGALCLWRTCRCYHRRWCDEIT